MAIAIDTGKIATKDASGRIHMGHVRNCAMGDVVTRHKRARLRSAAPESRRRRED